MPDTKLNEVAVGPIGLDQMSPRPNRHCHLFNFCLLFFPPFLRSSYNANNYDRLITNNKTIQLFSSGIFFFNQQQNADSCLCAFWINLQLIVI